MDKPSNRKYPNVNAHLHTPYSFSAFEKLGDALDQAVEEKVAVVGINDFYSTDGYDEWAKGCRERKLYPLFNIELIALQEEDREKGIRVNDPNNPGRTYLSGKGLHYPAKLAEPYATMLANVRRESNAQVEEMCGKLNSLLEKHGAGFKIDFNSITKELTKGLVRERHLAKAMRQAVSNRMGTDTTALRDFYNKIFAGKELKCNPLDYAALENEIRGNLLKAGGQAFVPENPEAFLPLENVRQLILAAGGIPTYPFLGDDTKGMFTDFEGDVCKAATTLKERGIFSVEFITTRNSVELLERYAGFLADNGFIVTFGTEHNTPAKEPVELFARGNQPLTEKLKRINYMGACAIAAHQHLVNAGKQGFVDLTGKPTSTSPDLFIELGDKLIQSAII